MKKPIRVHAGDRTDEEVRARHAAIEKRLDELGPDRVRASLLRGGFPNEWDSIIHAWLAGDKLEAD
jgi:hypothetical protein